MLIGGTINPLRSSYLSCKEFRKSYFILEITHQCNAIIDLLPSVLNLFFNFFYKLSVHQFATYNDYD